MILPKKGLARSTVSDPAKLGSAACLTGLSWPQHILCFGRENIRSLWVATFAYQLDRSSLEFFVLLDFAEEGTRTPTVLPAGT